MDNIKKVNKSSNAVRLENDVVVIDCQVLLKDNKFTSIKASNSQDILWEVDLITMTKEEATKLMEDLALILKD